MPRLPRYVLPGYPQHVIQRGTDRCPIFRSDRDFAFFHERLRAACRVHGCLVHAYVFMTNHVHLIVTPEQRDSISRTMQVVGTRYVQFFNAEHGRTGALWEGRYKATLIETDRYLLACYRYVELNPVRAGMVAHPGEYRWSSYHVNAGGRLDGLVTPHGVYLSLGRSAAERLAAYRRLFDDSLDRETLRDIRNATQKGWALGSDSFQKEMEGLSQRRTRPINRGGRRPKPNSLTSP